jgi:hypothetical protein
VRQGEHLSADEIALFLSSVLPELGEIALRLRAMVLACCPWASERLLWGGLSYHNPQRGGPVRGAVCQIELYEDHIRLSFIHGVRLEDPQALLQGERKSKRYLKITSLDEAPWKAIQDLIQAAARLDVAALEAPLKR